jgi:hypothetical protein
VTELKKILSYMMLIYADDGSPPCIMNDGQGLWAMNESIPSTTKSLGHEKWRSTLSALIVEYPMGWPLYNLQVRQALNFYNIYEYHHYCASDFVNEVRHSLRLWEYPELIYSAISSLSLSAKTLAGLRSIFASNSTIDKQIQINKFCKISYGNIIIGDQILSQYLRRSRTGRVTFDLKNLASAIKLSVKIPFVYLSLSKKVSNIMRTLKKGEKLKIVCMIPHEVRYEQVLRRLVYGSFGSDPDICLYEVVLDKETQENTLRSFSSSEDYLVSRRSIRRYEGLKPEFVDSAIKIMGERLSNTSGHVYFHTGNTNPDYDIETYNGDVSLPIGFPSVMDKMIALPLHQVSDDQFLFGYDDLGDIASYNDSIINYCVSRSLPLLIKHHPNAFNPRLPDKSLAEKSYIEYLISKYFTSEAPLCISQKNSIIASSLYPNIFLVPPKCSLVSFLMPYRNALIISRHGNIIVEAIYAGRPFMCSKYSRYNNFTLNPINIYSGKQDLFDTIDRYISGQCQASDFVISDKTLIRSIVASAYKSSMNTEARLNDKYVEHFFYPATSGTALTEDWERAFRKLKIDRYQSLASTVGLEFASCGYKDLFYPFANRD